MLLMARKQKKKRGKISLTKLPLIKVVKPTVMAIIWTTENGSPDNAHC